MPLDEIFLVFEKTTSALKKDIQEAKNSIANLKTAKIDKTDVLNRIGNLEKQITSSNRGTKNMESELKALDENLTQELAELSGNFHKIKTELNKFETIQKDISALSSTKLDKKGLETQLQNQEKRFQEELKSMQQELRKKDEALKSMESQIEELMKFKALSEIKKRLQPSTAPAPQQPADEPAASNTSKSEAGSGKTETQLLPPPQPGKIMEENLKP
jgi:predicted  nucleic acid-binding Zn-ribbon protein